VTSSSKARTETLALYAVAWLVPAWVASYARRTMRPYEVLEVPGYVPAQHPGLLGELLDAWQLWDGQWFLRIAADGYSAGDASPAFLPLYPSLVHGVASVTVGDHVLAGCLVSWGAFLAALHLLGKLFERELPAEDARAARLLLVAFPTAFYFHAAYTESLFLLLSVGAFLAARDGRFVVAGAAALGATATRWTGIALGPLLLVEALHAATERSAGRALAGAELTPRGLLAAARSLPARIWAASLLPLTALPLVCVYFDRTLGDPLAWTRAQRLWERRLAPPWTGLADGIRVLLPGNPPYLEPLEGGFPRLPFYGGGFLDAHGYNLVAALAGLGLSALALRHLRPAHALWALAGVVIPLMTPSRLQPLQSMPRFLVVLFPLFMILAVLLRGRPVALAATLAGFALVQGFFVARFALWYWVA